jgi:hypothetical protein
MSLSDIASARASLRAALTQFRKARVGTKGELYQRLTAILETLERIESGEVPMALYAARQALKSEP